MVQNPNCEKLIDSNKLDKQLRNELQYTREKLQKKEINWSLKDHSPRGKSESWRKFEQV